MGVDDRQDEDGIDQPWRDESILRELYVDEGLSINQIAERLDGATYAKVQYWKSKYGIESRDRRAATSAGKLDPEAYAVLSDRDELERRYVDDQMTQADIAEELGCSERTVMDWMADHGIQARDQTTAQRLAHANPRAAEVLNSEQKFRRMYVDAGMSVIELADHLDCSLGAISRAIDQHEVEPHGCLAGEDHPMWAGGYRDYYGPNWHSQRRKALERDGFACGVCRLPRREHKSRFGEDLHMHHIVPFRRFVREDGDVDYDRANRLENLITLCRGHHARWEGVPVRPETM